MVLHELQSCENLEARRSFKQNVCNSKKKCLRISWSVSPDTLFFRIIFISIILGSFSFINCVQLEVPSSKTISNFRNKCNATSNNNTNVSHYFQLTEAVIKNMSFNFCTEIHPIFSLPSGNKSDLVISVNFSENGIINNTNMYIPKNLSCDFVNELAKKEESLILAYDLLKSILQRSIVCVKNDYKHELLDCSECESSYKEWLCAGSGIIPLHINNQTLSPCINVAENVCLNCPAITVENSYGGFSAFHCIPTDTEDESCSASKCASYDCLLRTI